MRGIIMTNEKQENIRTTLSLSISVKDKQILKQMAIVVAEGNGWAILPTFSLLQASYFLPQLSFLSFKGKNAERRFYISYEDTVFEPTAENISSSLKTYLHEKVIPMVRELKPGLEKFIKA